MVLAEREGHLEFPLIENEAKVICLLQDLHDPLVEDRGCVLAGESKSQGWSRVLVKDFMSDVSNEYLNAESLVFIYLSSLNYYKDD
jgi:hypothetical protein